MNRLLVIGGASFDTLHFDDRTVTCAGGAGVYTAMAARRCGARTAMFAPRPDPCPQGLQPVAEQLTEWLGPAVPPEDLPRFEISHRGGKTEYLGFSLGAEATLKPAMLPADLSTYDLIHLTPIGDAAQQLAFMQACRQRGARKLSGGTGLFIAAHQPEVVRAAMDLSDIFFMNIQEAEAIFGSLEAVHCQPGQLLYVTLGAQGARIFQGNHATLIPAIETRLVDPTGAGDAFCGGTLAYLLQGDQPVMAARQAAPLAAETIAAIGPAALLSSKPPPQVPLDKRVSISDEQVDRVARTIAALAEVTPFPFVGPALPPVGHPQALDFFFAATLQQFSFWSQHEGRYKRPLLAGIGGETRKGSDYLWAAFWRRLVVEPDFCAPERQATLSHRELQDVFRADDGGDPMPALDLHLEQARQYGQDMLALGLTPHEVVDQARTSSRPLPTLLGLLDTIGGYKEDPLRKKSGLLAMILDQRPESFLPLKDEEQIAPVIDYHLLRSCLRIGLVNVLDETLHDRIRQRETVSAAEEWAIRYAAYRAIDCVTALSGKSMGAVDWFFFNARLRPEMTEPECGRCQVDAVCAHRKALFQPVFRTTFY